MHARAVALLGPRAPLGRRRDCSASALLAPVEVEDSAFSPLEARTCLSVARDHVVVGRMLKQLLPSKDQIREGRGRSVDARGGTWSASAQPRRDLTGQPGPPSRRHLVSSEARRVGKRYSSELRGG